MLSLFIYKKIWIYCFPKTDLFNKCIASYTPSHTHKNNNQFTNQYKRLCHFRGASFCPAQHQQQQQPNSHMCVDGCMLWLLTRVIMSTLPIRRADLPNRQFDNPASTMYSSSYFIIAQGVKLARRVYFATLSHSELCGRSLFPSFPSSPLHFTHMDIYTLDGHILFNSPRDLPARRHPSITCKS